MHIHTHHKTKGQEMRVGRELKRRKGKHGEEWHIKVLGLARAVDWSIDRLHSYYRRQLRRVELKEQVRPESRWKGQCPQILFGDLPEGKHHVSAG